MPYGEAEVNIYTRCRLSYLAQKHNTFLSKSELDFAEDTEKGVRLCLFAYLITLRQIQGERTIKERKGKREPFYAWIPD